MSDRGSEISATERAYGTIRDRILEARILPGTMLGETPLAAEIGLSRTPVRVALARLQDEGWITIYPKRGALVRGLDEREIADLADARMTLEITGVERASVHLRHRLADRLEQSVAEQRAAFNDGDLSRFIDLTLGFHRGFVEAGGNGVLLELYDRLADRHRFMLFSSGDRLLARCDVIMSEHADLVRHLRDGDAEAFASSLREHVEELTDGEIDGS